MSKYMNYSKEHYDAAEKVYGDGTKMTRAASLYITQSTLPGEQRIPDELELLYPNVIEISKEFK